MNSLLVPYFPPFESDFRAFGFLGSVSSIWARQSRFLWQLLQYFSSFVFIHETLQCPQSQICELISIELRRQSDHFLVTARGRKELVLSRTEFMR